MRIILGIKKGISNIVRVIMIAMVAVMSLSIAWSVFARNLFGQSFDSIIDINRILFVWSTFMGLVYVNGEGKLIRFELLEQRLEPSLRRVLHVFQGLAALILYVVMTIAGLKILSFADAQAFPTIPITLVWLYLPIAISGILLVTQTITSLVIITAEKS
jgi:TRAP-type C4-dicarboxylate transport system permease small subunit